MTTLHRPEQRNYGSRRVRRRDPSHLPVQLASVAVIVSTVWFAPWMFVNLDMADPYASIPFVCAVLYLVIQINLTIINNWRWRSPRVLSTPIGYEPDVAIIVPTCGEPTDMVYRTLMSVINQDWPIHRMIVVLSDDAPTKSMARMTRWLSWRNPQLEIRYHLPPGKGSPRRRGEAKAGNLNSALDFVRHEYPDVELIETRDADDLVGDRAFLRKTVAVLCADPNVAFAQTIKECYASPKDPFNNRELLFYRGQMKARHAANAMFPCGSGLVWRRTALEDIGDFPSWNLVEDFQSGVEALKRGWRSAYVPIVGAVAQYAPEDLGNVIKQRGTWALDTVRLLIWRSLKGMTLRQRLHFIEMGLFYFQGFPMLTLWAAAIIFTIQGSQPVYGTRLDYMVRFLPYIISVEILILALARAVGVRNILTVRRMWQGLMFVYMKAIVLAVWYGPNRKPVYRVTRKRNIARWYWRETIPHFVILFVMLLTIGYVVDTHRITDILRPDTLYWLAITFFGLGSFIPLGWRGVHKRRATGSRPAQRGRPGDQLRDGAFTSGREGIARRHDTGALEPVRLPQRGAPHEMPHRNGVAAGVHARAVRMDEPRRNAALAATHARPVRTDDGARTLDLLASLSASQRATEADAPLGSRYPQRARADEWA